VTCEGAERAEIIARRPLGDRRDVMRGDILDNIVRNLSRQPIKESALDLLNCTATLRRGTIKTVQATLHSMEGRLAAEQKSATLAKRFARQRVNYAIEGYLPGLVQGLRQREFILSRIADAGIRLVERLADLARPRPAMSESVAEFWRTTQGTEEHLSPASKQSRTNEVAKKRSVTR
jgi:hypothetical protein